MSGTEIVMLALVAICAVGAVGSAVIAFRVIRRKPAPTEGGTE